MLGINQSNKRFHLQSVAEI